MRSYPSWTHLSWASWLGSYGTRPDGTHRPPWITSSIGKFRHTSPTLTICSMSVVFR
jgi:hypothetical protein